MSLRYVIADDNAGFLQAAVTLLEREGARVVGLATNGAEALRLAGELQPDVVLVDIDLGEDSGFDVARALAHNGGGGGAPTVILISTYAEAELAELIAEAPVAGYVAKSELSADAIARLANG